MSRTISECKILRSLQVVLPYHAPNIQQLASLLEATKPTCVKLEFWFLQSRTCTPPSSTHLLALDATLQHAHWDKLTKVEVQHHGVQEPPAPAAFAWGDVPTWLPPAAAEAEKLHAELRAHMPQTHARGLLRCSRNAKPDKFAPV